MKQILCNKYEILRPIAEGGMGIVYLVKDLHLNKLAAVKVSKNQGRCGGRDAALGEMEVLKRLSHPALPSIIDFFEEGGNICLVMEYIEGITLEQYLRKFTKAQVHQAVRWAVELTEVLGYLHGQNPPVIYRDLKPANIMIRPDGRICLVDFGAAFVTSCGQERGQLMMGTAGYSAPEQWQSGNAGKTSDIYGLGAVLHEMLTGSCPQKLFAERRPVREYDRSIPRELEKTVSMCTRKRPCERYQSMEQLRKALLGYRRRGRSRESLFGIRQGIARLLLAAAIIRLFLPFCQGVKASEFPFPYLTQPLMIFGAALLYRLLFLRKPERCRVLLKQEKSVFLTEKKFSGIYVSGIVLLLIWGGLLFQGESGLWVSAEEKTQVLWVEMRDEKNRKLLLREGTVYQAGESVRFEVPADRMPEGEVALRLTAQDEAGGIYESRIFLVEKEN